MKKNISPFFALPPKKTTPCLPFQQTNQKKTGGTGDKRAKGKRRKREAKVGFWGGKPKKTKKYQNFFPFNGKNWGQNIVEALFFYFSLKLNFFGPKKIFLMGKIKL